jgi:hypothetical protein
MKLSAWLHWLLAIYLWLITWIPLGNWNHQKELTLFETLARGGKLDAGDVIFLALVALPAILFWIGYQKRNLWFALAALVLDAVWLVLQIQSWWIPYVFGTDLSWQLAYAKGPTTKVLPSFGHHVAPDGMHFVISVLIVAAMITGVTGLMGIRRDQAAAGVSA